jgi:hypothetical protein
MSGLEVVGSIASVLQLAATVYSISKTLYEVGDALSNAPSDIKDLARDLETFSEELHLLSSLLSDKTHRYSDRVYRLTAKIIGDCASICVKIDRILRKLRSGSFLARVKWVFKEKEIMKLLARLRDLKLSLMGTLSLLSALKADHMMDAMGVGNPSLLEGPKDERLSKETADEVENTRRKLAGISADQKPDTPLPATLSGTTLVPLVSQTSADTQHSLNSSEEKAELSSSITSLIGTTSSHISTISREIGQQNASIFISTMAIPPPNPLMQLPQAMASVQSFYSALSRYENEDLEVTNTRSRNVINSNITPSPHVNSPKGLAQSSVEEWKADIINSAMKRFGMAQEDARSWVSALPVPSIPGSDVLDPPAISRPLPSALVDETGDDDDWGLGIGRHVPTASTLNANNYETTGDYDEDYIEFKAAMGFAGMRIAQVQDAYSRGSPASGIFEGKSPDQQTQDESSDSESENKYMDLGLVGGGYDAHMSYGAEMKAGHSSEMDGQSRPILMPSDLGTSDSYGEELAIIRERLKANIRERLKERNPGQAAEVVENERPMGTLAEAKYNAYLDNAKRAEISSGLTESAHSTKKTHLQTPSQFYATAQHPSLALGNLNSVPDGEDGYVAASEGKGGKKGRITAGIEDSSITNAFLGSIGDEERSKPPAATTPSNLASNLSLTLGQVRGSSPPTSDDYMGPPPRVPWRGAKPAALRLSALGTKPATPSQPSRALQSLKSARSLSVLNSSVYPPNIVAPGKGLRYDIEFLLQFQKVCTWMPSMEFGSQIKALFRDDDRGRFGSILARKRQGTNVDSVDIRGRTLVGGAALGAMGAEVITRARTRDREDEKERSRSRSRSESTHSHAKLKTGLGLDAAGLAAAAAVKYAGNRKITVETLGRGRSRTRSPSRRRRSYSSYSSDEDRHSGSRYMTVHRYRVRTGKVAGQAVVDNYRESDIRFAKSSQEREANYELERYSRETDYYDRHELPQQPIVIRQEAPAPKQILGRQLNESAKRTQEDDKYYYRRDVRDVKYVAERSRSATRPGTELKGVGLGVGGIAGLYENRKQKDEGKGEDSTAFSSRSWEFKKPLSPPSSPPTTKEGDNEMIMGSSPDFEVKSAGGQILDRSSSLSSRQLSCALPMIPVSTSLSPGQPVSPHTTPSIPSRLSENSTAEQPIPPRSSQRSSFVVERSENNADEANELGANAVDIPTSLRPYSPPDLRSGTRSTKRFGSEGPVWRRVSVSRPSIGTKQEADYETMPPPPGSGHIRGPDTMPLTGPSSLLLARPSRNTITQKTLGKIQDLEHVPLLFDMSQISSDDNQKSTDGPRQGDSESDTQRESSSFEPFRSDPRRNWSSSITEKHNDLWLRAFAQLQARDSASSQNIWVAWVAAHSYLPSLATDDSVARMTATSLGSVMDMTRTQLLESPTELSRSTASCIENFSKILNVMQETLNFKPGAFIWTCLCSAEKVCNITSCRVGLFR